MSDLDDLLSRLAHTPKRPTTYLGKAVGKDEANLHLAVDTGVIAIPIAAITDVKRLETGVENAVSVEVSDATEITQILKVRPANMMTGQDPEIRSSWSHRPGCRERHLDGRWRRNRDGCRSRTWSPRNHLYG